MKTKFTKGEWYIEDFYSINETRIISNGKRICEAKHYGKKIHPRFKEPSKIEGKANAKLISAAPDLFEALQKIMKTQQSMDWCESNSEFIYMAQKAIKKATE